MPLSLTELQEIAVDNFADDVSIPPEASEWTRQDAEVFFASGGVKWPQQDNPLPLLSEHSQAATELQRPLVWSRESGDVKLELSAVAQTAAAHADKISGVSLFVDTQGVVAEQAGDVVAVTGSWDMTVRLWRVGSAGGGATPPMQLCELAHQQSRWVYSVACCGYIGGGGKVAPQLGVVSTQTGGMTGEPQHLIRLWSVGREAAAAKGEVTMLVNIEGGNPAHRAPNTLSDGPHREDRTHVHMRGVHAVGCCADRMATVSTDVLAMWALDRRAARFAEIARAPCPLRVGSTPTGLRWLRDGCTVGLMGEVDNHAIPLVQLRTDGSFVTETLGYRSSVVNDLIELDDAPHDETAPPSRIVVANANRAFVYDRRAGSAPCARLPLPGISSLASVAGGGGAAPALLAAAGKAIHVYDVRRLPEDTKSAKLPPALATLTGSGGAWTSLATHGSLVVAASSDHALGVWDVAAPPQQHAGLDAVAVA